MELIETKQYRDFISYKVAINSGYTTSVARLNRPHARNEDNQPTEWLFMLGSFLHKETKQEIINFLIERK